MYSVVLCPAASQNSDEKLNSFNVAPTVRVQTRSWDTDHGAQGQICVLAPTGQVLADSDHGEGVERGQVDVKYYLILERGGGSRATGWLRYMTTGEQSELGNGLRTWLHVRTQDEGALQLFTVPFTILQGLCLILRLLGGRMEEKTTKYKLYLAALQNNSVQKKIRKELVYLLNSKNRN